MSPEELRTKLSEILTEEEKSFVDWGRVAFLSEQLIVRLTEPDTPRLLPEEIVPYLAGYNRRRSDEAFAIRQRSALRTILRRPI